MYNPRPLGKSTTNGAPKGAPQWRPLQPLKPIELQNAGFVQENLFRASNNKFSLWTVEEQIAATQLLDSEAAKDPEADEHASQSAIEESLSHDNATSNDNLEDSLSSMDASKLEKIKKEAFERGVAEGKKIQAAESKAQVEEIETQSLSALAEKTNQLLQYIEKGVMVLQENPQDWNEPLKRLALHLAEQLTLTELSMSPTSIQNLIDRCIETLDVQSVTSVVVEMNPNDMTLLQNHKAVPGEKSNTWRLIADSHLLPGSVRVRADDAVVSDLIEHRLETLAQGLLQNTKPWQAQSAFQPERLSTRRGKTHTIDDVSAKALNELDIAEVTNDLEDSSVNLTSMDLTDLDLPDLDLDSSQIDRAQTEAFDSNVKGVNSND